MFQTKNFISITAGALNRMRGSTDKITDFRPGSVARTLIEGPALEIDQLYQQMFIGLREAIPVATFLSFGFEKLASATATGTLTVSRLAPGTEDVTIPVGTIFTASDGRRYLSTEAVLWAQASLSISVPVRAETPGSSGNAPSGVITASGFFTGGETITNAPVTNGRDQETDAEREARFADFVASLSRGTVDAVRYAAGSAEVLSSGTVTEYVTRVGVDEHPGFVRIYLYGSNGLPSAALLADAQRRLDGYRDENGVAVPGFRAAGVRVSAYAMAEVPVDFSASVEMFPGYLLDTAKQNAMLDAFAAEVASIGAGETLYIDSIVTRLLAISGVRRVVPSSDANIICGQSQVLVTGNFSVVPLNG